MSTRREEEKPELSFQKVTATQTLTWSRNTDEKKYDGEIQTAGKKSYTYNLRERIGRIKYDRQSKETVKYRSTCRRIIIDISDAVSLIGRNRLWTKV